MKKRKMIAGLSAVICLLAGCRGSEEQYLQQAEQYLKQGEYSLALEQYNKAIMEDEDLQEAYRGAGIACMKAADYEKAENYFLRALKESDGMLSEIEIDLSYYLGEVQIVLQKYEEAISCYSSILEYDDKETEAYLYRGAAKLRMNKEKEAKKDFDKAAESKDMKVLYGIYEAYEAAGSGDGQPFLEQVVKMDGKTGKDLYIIGRAYDKLGDEEKAIEALSKSEGKKEYQAVFYLGTIYERRGEYEKALQSYEQYKNQKGLTFSEYQTVSECMMKTGEYEAALDLNHYMRESAGQAETKDLKFEEIVIYERSGNFKEAANRAQAYTEEYPEDEEGKKEYEFLMTR